EALAIMNSSLDRMDRQGIKTVIIIHGHGTGAMKQAVRESLKMSIYVRDFRPGEMGEGGDGVSVASLR
ncbi:MAG TPA: Smr/MutS family protein, partial [Spirochaetota bacterium]|nr:Smr/MutS family protein [Spirochaetota bacterium]